MNYNLAGDVTTSSDSASSTERPEIAAFICSGSAGAGSGGFCGSAGVIVLPVSKIEDPAGETDPKPAVEDPRDKKRSFNLVDKPAKLTTFVFSRGVAGCGVAGAGEPVADILELIG